MNINWVTLHVRDMQASKAFYAQMLGMKEVRSFSPAPDMQITFLSAENGMQMELISGSGCTARAQGLSIGVSTADYDGVLAAAKETGLALRGPMVLGGYLECFFIKDPDGVELQVMKA